MILRKIPLSGILVAFLGLLVAFGCTPERTSPDETADSPATDTLPSDEKPVPEPANATPIAPEGSTLGMNDFERSLMAAIDEDLYLLRTDEGYDCVRTDLNRDGIPDAVALVTSEPDPARYDFDSDVFLMVFTGRRDGSFQRLAQSGNLGGASTNYKSFKKLLTENGRVTYTHQSMRNHMEVAIARKGSKAVVETISMCYYDTPPCTNTFVASDTNVLELHELTEAFLSDHM